MRRTLAGLTAVCVLVLAGCGDSDNDPGTQAGEARGDSGGGGGGEDFCAVFEDVIARGGAMSNDEVLEAVRAVDPPSEIEDDLVTFIESIEASAAGDQAAIRERADEFTQASAAVEGYVVDECGIDTATPPGSGGSPPSSVPGQRGTPGTSAPSSR